VCLVRRIIRVGEDGSSVALEARLESERELHEAVDDHPEVLPHTDLGLNPLIPLASELGVSSGSIDLLAADAQGRLAIVEFKKGTENPDVRHVVAQLLDYGAGLWRLTYEQLEQQCLRDPTRPGGALAEYAQDRLTPLGEAFDEDAFKAGVERCLDSGDFTFVYCGRDLDERTRRIMTYLAEGPRIRMFAVEVECYRESEGSGLILVPRATFVPSWIAGAGGSGSQPRTAKDVLADAPPEFWELVGMMDGVAQKLGLRKEKRATGWSYLPHEIEQGVQWPAAGIGVYASGRGMEVNLSALRDLGKDDVADEILDRLEGISGHSLRRSRLWPAVPCAAVVQSWDAVHEPVVERYFLARAEEQGQALYHDG
jgi:hypothetical protein